jgi:DNA-binding MarR family transcriptional regulator
LEPHARRSVESKPHRGGWLEFLWLDRQRILGRLPAATTCRTDACLEITEIGNRIASANCGKDACMLQVLQALVALALRRGTRDVRVSSYELSELTGFSPCTVSRKFRKIKTMGWITKVETGETGLRVAPTWRLASTSAAVSNAPVGWRPGMGAEVACRLRAAQGDPFSGDGRSFWRCWALLDVEEGQTVKQLAVRLERVEGTVRRHVNALAALGVARRVDGRWLRCGSDETVAQDLADLAERRGTTGAMTDLAEKHRKQRAEFEAHVAAARLERKQRQGESTELKVDPETGEIVALCLTLISWHPPGWVDRRPGRQLAA